MWNLYYRSPRLLALTIFLILVAGFSAVQVLPRKEDPTLSKRFAFVLTSYPGADAEQIESLITEPLEEAIQEIEEVSEIISTSRTGISVCNIELKDEVTDVETVWSRMRDKISDVGLTFPEGASEPELDDTSTDVDAYSMIVALKWTLPGEAPKGIIRRHAEDLDDRIKVLAGTKQTDRFGEPEEEILVEVDPERLASLGLTVAELSDIIAGQDSKLPAGQMRSQESSLVIEIEGEFDSLQRIKSIAVRRNQQDSVVLLGQIAEIRRSLKDPSSEIALIDGQPAVTVSARVEPNYRVDNWARDARAMLEGFRSELPRGIELDIIFDQSRYVEQRLEGLAFSLFLAGILVVLVVTFMMGLRSALLVGTALPLVSLMVLAGLRLLGVPIHQMSITGLVIALGLLIDNAIIVVDEVRDALHRGRSASKAVADSVRHLAVPLAGSTFTTVLAFLPLVLMPGPAGEFVGSIGLSVILALVSSFLVSLTVVAALTGRFYRLRKSGPSDTLPTDLRFWRAGFYHPRLGGIFERTLQAVFRRPISGVLIALILPALGFWNMSKLEEQFFPAADRKEFEIQFKLPSQASIVQTQEAAIRVGELLSANPRVERVHWFVGGSAPKFYYNMLAGQDDTPSFAQALVMLDSSKEAEQVISDLQATVTSAFPQAEVIVRQFGQGPPVEAPIELRLFGPDLERLYHLGEEFRAELAKDPDVVVARTTLRAGIPKLWMRIDEEEARLAGLDAVGIARQLQSTLEGSVGGSLMESTEELPVRVRVGGEDRADISRIASLEVLPQGEDPGPDRPRIPASALGRVTLVPDLASITRVDSRRANTVQAFVTAGVLPSQVLEPFRERIQPLVENLPYGYSWEFAGETKERNSAVAQLLASAGVLLVLMIASLVLSFNSFRLAGSILLVALSSAGLAMLALYLFDFPFGFMAIVGTMGLIGIAVNDSIVVLAAIRKDAGARAGDIGRMVGVVMHSTRHVMTTTITTMAGFTPLLLGGDRFWPPLAISIAGGILGATLLALFFIPSTYLLISRRSVAEPTPAESLEPASASA